MLLLKKKQVKI